MNKPAIKGYTVSYEGPGNYYLTDGVVVVELGNCWNWTHVYCNWKDALRAGKVDFEGGRIERDDSGDEFTSAAPGNVTRMHTMVLCAAMAK